MSTGTDRPIKALLYVRVSTEEQADKGASLEAQEQALAAEALRRGYEFEVVREEGKSAKSLQGRDELARALDLLDKHHAQVLMAVRMDRLSRNVGDVDAIMRRSKKRGWGIILSGDEIDTTPDGEFRTYLDAALAQRERGIIGLRTREGMAQRKAEGWPNGRAGRSVDATFLPTYKRIIKMATSESMSMNAIARTLNNEKVATARGGKWHPSTVRAVLTSETAKTLAG